MVPFSGKIEGGSGRDLAHLLKGDGGMDLLSSAEIALTTVQVPCEFQADWTRFIFQGKFRALSLKNEPWPICSKLKGDLPHGEGNLP